MIRLLLSTLLLLITATHSYAVNTFHNNQVTQMIGQKYHIYIPIERIRIRQGPSLDTKQIGLITDENEKSYVYKPHDSKWLTVSTLEGDLVGYSYEELFRKRPVAVLKDEVKTTEGIYRIEFIGYEFDATVNTYSQLQYYYQLFLNDEEIFTKGSKTRFNNIQPRLAGNGDEEIPTQFHSLTIQDKKVGWLFGWNKYEDDGYYTDLDFSFARIFVPQHSVSSSSESIDRLFTGAYEGIKFRTIADLLDKEPNQLLITPTDYQGNVFFGGAALGYYYIPRELRVTKIGDEVAVSKSDIKINQRLIDSDPAHVYAIAFNIDDHAVMKKVSSKFQGEMEIASESCGKYDVSIEIMGVQQGGYIDMYEYWKRAAGVLGYEDRFPLSAARDAASCIEGALMFSRDFVWHFFYRTGLFPSRKTIDHYIEKQYKYAQSF